MKRWAVVTALLYALALLLLTAPVLWLGFVSTKPGDSDISLKDIRDVYLSAGYFAWLGVLVLGQLALLRLPLDVSQRRLPAQRSVRLPIVVSAFFAANLLFAGIFSLLCAIFHDDLFPPMTAGHHPSELEVASGCALTLLIFWLAWALLFRAFARDSEPRALLARLTRWLLRGSILELLVAVPTHVIVRRRQDCCAPMGTFWGIATGISVMLLCFGPGVFFLFAERAQRLRPKQRAGEP